MERTKEWVIWVGKVLSIIGALVFIWLTLYEWKLEAILVLMGLVAAVVALPSPDQRSKNRITTYERDEEWPDGNF